jgi:tRNA pseudouridine38-40 synthase
MMQSEWSQIGESRWIYTVKANRFLRGMVRLIVGMCINVGRGKLSLSDVRTSLEQQERMAHPWSAPAEGLYLYDIDYDEEIFTKGSPNRLFFPI